MFEIEVVKRVKIPTLSEEVIKELLVGAIQKKLPEGVVINSLDFKVTRKGTQEVTLNVDAQFADAEPVKTKPIKLPEADDVEEEAEPELSRDRVAPAEKSQLDLIDEVLAEEEQAEPETKPTTGKSLAELFNT